MYAHDLHCPTSIYQPEEVGVCDRCYRKFRLADLNWQFDQSGAAVTNRGIRVCADDYDEVATILAPIIIVGPEGVVRDPRPPQYAANAQGGTPAPNLNGFPFLAPNQIPPDGP